MLAVVQFLEKVVDRIADHPADRHVPVDRNFIEPIVRHSVESHGHAFFFLGFLGHVSTHQSASRRIVVHHHLEVKSFFLAVKEEDIRIVDQVP